MSDKERLSSINRQIGPLKIEIDYYQYRKPFCARWKHDDKTYYEVHASNFIELLSKVEDVLLGKNDPSVIETRQV